MRRSRPGSRPSGRRVRDEVASGGRSDASHKGAANTQRRRRCKSNTAKQPTYVWQWLIGATRKSGSSSGTTRSVGRLSGASWSPSQENSDHRDTPENAEPRLAKENDEIADPNDPTDPIDSTEPTLPMDRME